jgi:hypothetical protein
MRRKTRPDLDQVIKLIAAIISLIAAIHACFK